MLSPSRRCSREPRVLCFPFPSQRRGCQDACSSRCGRMNWRDDSPSLGPCSLRRSVRLPRRSASNNLGCLEIGSRGATVEGRECGGTNPGGLVHFPGTPALRGCTEGADGLGLRPRLGVGKVCGFCLCGVGLFWPSTFSGLAHFEIGGAHFPIPAGGEDVSGDSGAVELVFGISHPLGLALTCMKRRVSV